MFLKKDTFSKQDPIILTLCPSHGHVVTHIYTYTFFYFCKITASKALYYEQVYLTTNIFRIPHNMVLPEDQIQMDSPVSQEELVEVQEKIALATKKILAVSLNMLQC